MRERRVRERQGEREKNTEIERDRLGETQNESETE